MQHEHSDPTVAEASDGYERYFGLAESPFKLTSSPRFLFESASYRAALKEIDYALSRREQIIVVTGPIGTGKTTLCRMIAERRGPRTVVATISRPPETVDDLFRQVLDAFGLLTEDTKSIVEVSHFALQKVLRQFLDSLVALNAQAILVFDEAQHLRPAVLEEIRLLSNMDADRQLLQVVLVGQPELDDLLARTDLGHLDQRVSRRHRLDPLQATEVRAYVERRLSAAQTEPHDGELPQFTNSAMQEIATLSRGVPRVINILCDRALENAWSDKTHTVDTAAVVRAAKSLNIDVPSTVSDRLRRFYAPAAVAAALGAVALLLWTVGSAAMARWNHPASAPPPRVVQQAARPAPAKATAQTTPAPAAAAPPPKAQAPPPESATADKLLIVVSSFRTKDRSAQVAADIVAQGFPAFVRSNSGWQQVVVGPYLSRDEAVAAQKRLAGARYPDTTVEVGSATTP